MKNDLTAPVKDTYKLKNWSSNNKRLWQRGQITLWIEESVLGLGKGVKQIIPPPIDAIINDINKGTKRNHQKYF